MQICFVILTAETVFGTWSPTYSAYQERRYMSYWWRRKDIHLKLFRYTTVKWVLGDAQVLNHKSQTVMLCRNIITHTRPRGSTRDFIIIRTWSVCQVTGNYHLNASFEHACGWERRRSPPQRRLCIIHKTYPTPHCSLELVSVVINGWTQVVRRDYFQIDRTAVMATPGDHAVPPGRPSVRIIDTRATIRLIVRAGVRPRMRIVVFPHQNSCADQTAEMSQGSLATVHLAGGARKRPFPLL